MATTAAQAKCDVKNIELADLGKKRIEWANQSMKVLQLIRKEFIKNQPLKGIRVDPGLPHRVENTGRTTLRYYVCGSPGTDPLEDRETAEAPRRGLDA